MSQRFGNFYKITLNSALRSGPRRAARRLICLIAGRAAARADPLVVIKGENTPCSTRVYKTPQHAEGDEAPDLNLWLRNAWARALPRSSGFVMSSDTLWGQWITPSRPVEVEEALMPALGKPLLRPACST